jgi:hypothetical protein
MRLTDEWGVYSILERTDITEITNNEVIHGDVTIAQTQATARLTQSCKLISNNATKNPDPQHMSQHRPPPHPLRPVQGTQRQGEGEA